VARESKVFELEETDIRSCAMEREADVVIRIESSQEKKVELADEYDENEPNDEHFKTHAGGRFEGVGNYL